MAKKKKQLDIVIKDKFGFPKNSPQLMIEILRDHIFNAQTIVNSIERMMLKPDQFAFEKDKSNIKSLLLSAKNTIKFSNKLIKRLELDPFKKI